MATARERPTSLDCAYETVCETCVHFATGPEFVPVLLRRRDHAAERGQHALVSDFDHLLARAEGDDDHPPGYAGEGPINPGLPACAPLCPPFGESGAEVRSD